MDNTFESIGLSAKEVEIYRTVLKLGESPVADILNETQDHPQIVYRALDALSAKNLVFTTYKRHRKYVRAESPRVIEKMAEKQVEDIRQQIPDLLALQKMTKDTIVRVYKGSEGVRSVRDQAIDAVATGP